MKSKEDYLKSRDKRNKMIQHFGFVPLSILEIPKASKIKVIQYQEEKKETRVINSKYPPGHPFYSSGRGSRGGDAYSIMPTSLVEFCIKYYAKKNDLYLDPFAAQGVQMQVAKAYGLNYIGYDICHKFMEFNYKIRDLIDDKKTKIELYEKDSRTIGQESLGWNFCFTSPPYWDIEEYDHNPLQLGVDKTYEQFINGLCEVYKSMYKVAADNAHIIININDFRKEGKFYSYHSDTIDILIKAGFKIIDIGILGTGVVSGLAKCFAVSFNDKKILPKVHEYLIIGKK